MPLEVASPIPNGFLGDVRPDVPVSADKLGIVAHSASQVQHPSGWASIDDDLDQSPHLGIVPGHESLVHAIDARILKDVAKY
jgi:hypothetical protein